MAKNNYWYEIEGVEFIWHGEWADPELYSEKYDCIVNSVDVEEYFYNNFKEEVGDEINAWKAYVRQFDPEADYSDTCYGSVWSEIAFEHYMQQQDPDDVAEVVLEHYQAAHEYAVTELSKKLKKEIDHVFDE